VPPADEARCGVDQALEAQVRPLIVAILRFTQLQVPLPPLKPMEQSRRGAPHLLEAQMRPLVVATVYIVEVLTSVGVPLMVQVALSILKPVGRVGATVQLAIAPSELLKVMFVMVEPRYYCQTQFLQH
jgi:hypothetical protein